VTLTSPTPDPFEGTPYRTLRALGAGGMGEVLLVQHREVGKQFAAKLLHGYLASDPRTLERMRIEAESAGQLQHPHITSVAAFGKTHDGRPFIVMEYLRGRTLREELVERGPLPLLEVVTYGAELLSALAAAHGIGIVHRDIKPDNLFLCDGPRRTLKVLDFGIARVATAASPIKPLPEELLTNTGELIGTPLFQSPEGALGQHVDARADVYAAGLMLYVMLTGRGPFDHHAGSAVLSAHVTEVPEPPSRYARAPIPAELERAVLKALSKHPDQRFQSAEEFRHALLEVAAFVTCPPGWLETSAFRRSDPVPTPLPSPASLAPAPASPRALATSPTATPASTSVRPRALGIAALAAIFLLTGAAAAAAVAGLYGALHGGP
jgi:eukaryotic-like serine/threonine-protein kinase